MKCFLQYIEDFTDSRVRFSYLSSIFQISKTFELLSQFVTYSYFIIETIQCFKLSSASASFFIQVDILHAVEDCTLRSQQDDTIYWHYKGTFLDGTEFHSGNFYATLGHGHVIEGVDKGMRGLCVGDKRRSPRLGLWCTRAARLNTTKCSVSI